MWVFDVETLAFVEVNDAAVAHYGYSREDFLKKTIKDIRPPEDIPDVLATLSNAQSGYTFSASCWLAALVCLYSCPKSGIGFSFGVPGARVGVNAKGKKYVRGGIPGTGIYYQSSLPDAEPGQAPQPGQPPQSTASISPLGILIAVLVVGLIIYGMSSSTQTTTSVPAAPVPQVVAPVAAPVTPKHVVRKHRGKHAAHRAAATATKPDVAPAAESAEPGGVGDGDIPSR
jgi:Protein of unknown function (DUF4236)